MKQMNQFFISVSLLATLSMTQVALAQPIACQLLLEMGPVAEANQLKKFLTGPEGTSDQSVVKPIGHRKGKVVFVKNKDEKWVSRHNAIANSLTAEGDVRLPILLLGPELAAKLGYAIREVGKNSIEIEVPDADLLAERVGKINKSLKARGLEPITYLPVRSGFVTVKETIQMMLSASGDYQLHFPYADRDFPLVNHEVSFHLGAVLLNKKITSRAREIIEETQSFINLIDAHRAEIGDVAIRLKGQIRIERNFEMEAGLASMVTTPGFSRRDNGMKSYNEIIPLISQRYMKYLVRNVEYLARPTLQPFEAVLTRLHLITGVDVKALIKSDNSNYQTFSLEQQRIGIQVKLNDQELAILKKIAVEFASKPRALRETGTPESWLNEFLLGLDQRIKDINESL
jgi:hypothetical protein